MGVLKNKSFKSYDRLSRYVALPYYYHSKDNKYTYGTTRHLKTDTYYVLHMVQRGDTFDSLALEYYNNPTYYWIIMDFNRIQDPFTELEEGVYIKIPSISKLEWA